MKLLWFHLMPYTELPDDFRENHPSIWVDIDSRLFDPARAHNMYNDFMDELEYAAEVGLHGICVNEHHSNGYGLMPSPNLIASTLARRTSDAAICIMGNSLALYNPPTRVAEEMDQELENVEILYSNSLYETPIRQEYMAADCFHPNAEGQEEIARQLWQDQPWFH